MQDNSAQNQNGAKTLLLVLVLVIALIGVRQYLKKQSFVPNDQQSPATLGATASSVPAAYQALYGSLQSQLDNLEQKFNQIPQPQNPTALIYGSDLVAANDNVGVGLLQPGAMKRVDQQLDALQKIGVGGVHVTIQWPLFSAKYDPDYQKYLEFYKNVAQDLKKRGMKFFAHNTVNFGAPFSGYNHAVPKVSFNDYKADKRAMVEEIINQLHPDYLILGSEPSTDAHNAGLPELKDPAKSKELMDYVLNGGSGVPPLNKQGVLVGAGAGSWDGMQFDQNYVAIPGMDFISLHIYPIDPKNVDSAVTMGKFIKDSGKQLVIDEIGMYKREVNEPYAGPVAGAPETYKRDVFSFFAPLDQRFITDMVKFAKSNNAVFISYFWQRNLWAYVTYQKGDENRSYTELQKRENQAALAALNNGQTSLLGQTYQQLIQTNR